MIRELGVWRIIGPSLLVVDDPIKATCRRSFQATSTRGKSVAGKAGKGMGRGAGSRSKSRSSSQKRRHETNGDGEGEEEKEGGEADGDDEEREEAETAESDSEKAEVPVSEAAAEEGGEGSLADAVCSGGDGTEIAVSDVGVKRKAARSVKAPKAPAVKVKVKASAMRGKKGKTGASAASTQCVVSRGRAKEKAEASTVYGDEGDVGGDTSKAVNEDAQNDESGRVREEKKRCGVRETTAGSVGEPEMNGVMDHETKVRNDLLLSLSAFRLAKWR